MESLLHRLRIVAAERKCEFGHPGICAEAADEIERLQGTKPAWQPMSLVPKHGRRIYVLQRGGQASIVYANPELERAPYLAWWPLPEHHLAGAREAEAAFAKIGGDA